MRKLRVLLDANVIVNSLLRDVFFTAAEMGLIDIHFSDDILEEVDRALRDELGIDVEKVASLVDAIRHAFPFGCVTGYAHRIETLDLPDPDDRHVLAAAVHGECDVLVTFNMKDFPAEAVDPVDLVVLSPDDAIVLLGNDFGSAMAPVVHKMSERLAHPHRTVEELVAGIAPAAPRGVIVLGARLGLPGYELLEQDMIASGDEESAQTAAWRLIEAVLARDANLVGELVEPDFATELTGRKQPRPEAVLAVLVEVFANISDPDEWGVGSAFRPHEAQVELVKFVRIGDKPRVMAGPTFLPGHLLYLRLSRGLWRLVGLNGPDPGEIDVDRDPDPPR